MMRLDIHLNFQGQCGEAFEFYSQCLGTRIDFAMRYHEAPPADQGPPEMHDKILHTSMRIGDTNLMGADSPPGHQQTPQGFAVSLAIEDPGEAERVFAAMSADGKITMPMAETFWAKRFGMFTDKFGQPWMINCSKPM